MSITLFCLVKGNTTANAFPVHIDKGQFVGDLKEVIKAKKAPEFDNFPADKLKLWKVEIGGDHLDDPLKNLTLNDNNELSAINEIGDYWTEKPPKKHIHVLVEPPASNVASSREQELLDRIAALEEKLSKSEYGTCKVVGMEERLCEKFFNPVVTLQHSMLSLVQNERRASSGP
ncbi:hypothetical protein C1646_666780 [Rhizophagus diaphanus]|nr:hypothetical protein C1646_666780 [Rhizophagus diaphanus] [Rhizophagus sp. MUCL 43196]